MMEVARLHIPGEIVGKARPRVTRSGHAFTPEKTKNAEALVRLLAAVAMGGRAPHSGPVRLTYEATIGVPASWSKRKRAEALNGLVPAMCKPDLDNAVKLIADGLNDIVLFDDKQITEIVARKRYGSLSGALVIVEALDVDRSPQGANDER